MVINHVISIRRFNFVAIKVFVLLFWKSLRTTFKVMDFVSLFFFLPFSPPHIRCSPKEEQFFFCRRSSWWRTQSWRWRSSHTSATRCEFRLSFSASRKLVKTKTKPKPKRMRNKIRTNTKNPIRKEREREKKRKEKKKSNGDSWTRRRRHARSQTLIPRLSYVTSSYIHHTHMSHHLLVVVITIPHICHAHYYNLIYLLQPNIPFIT